MWEPWRLGFIIFEKLFAMHERELKLKIDPISRKRAIKIESFNNGWSSNVNGCLTGRFNLCRSSIRVSSLAQPADWEWFLAGVAGSVGKRCWPSCTSLTVSLIIPFFLFDWHVTGIVKGLYYWKKSGVSTKSKNLKYKQRKVITPSN